MPKTVEEILKEQGVIKEPPPEEKEKIKFEEEIDLRKIVMSIEKLQTQIDTFKDVREQNDEKIRELTEKIGEIRSLFFQREGLIKETETKVKMLEDVVTDINPSKYMKEMEKRKEEILEAQAKVEKVEVVEKELNDGLSKIRQTMQNIKSVENLENMLNEVKDNISKSRELRADIDRMSGKTERFYFEMENRIKDFVDLKGRIDKTDDLVRELTRTADGINIRLSGFVLKTDLEDFKKSANSIISSNKDFIDKKIKEIESFLSLPSEEINNRVDQLKKRRVEVSNLLVSLEEQYKKAFISQKTYDEVKQKNENILKQIEEELGQLQAGEGFSLKNLPSIISRIEDRANNIDRKIENLEKTTEESFETLSPDSKLSNITEVIKVQTNMLDDLIKKVKEINDKVASLSITLSSFDSRIRFFEILDSLIRVDSSKDITFYLSQLEDLISSMKVVNAWDGRRESLTLNLLTDIGNNWRKYGYNEVAKVFDDEIERIKSIGSNKVMLKY
jgi:chromosome segregation ATPase